MGGVWRAKGSKPETAAGQLTLDQATLGSGDQDIFPQYRGDKIPKGKPGNCDWHVTDLPSPRGPRTTVRRHTGQFSCPGGDELVIKMGRQRFLREAAFSVGP